MLSPSAWLKASLISLIPLSIYFLIYEVIKHTDINKLIIDEESSTVYLKDLEMSLDVGAIAKGYAVEKTALTMEKAGFKNGMISVGGNVRTIGNKFDDHGEKTPWNVGI